MNVRLLGDGGARASALDRETLLHACLDHAVHYLPTQGPIKVFVHHNTLHAFEDLPFDQGVLEGRRFFGGEPYFSEARYYAEYLQGRITSADIDDSLREDLGDSFGKFICDSVTRYDLRRAMLRDVVSNLPHLELKWLLRETDTLRTFPQHIDRQTIQRALAATNHPTGKAWTEASWLQALFDACLSQAKATQQVQETSTVCNSMWGRRHAELLDDTFGEDPDDLTHELLIRFCGAFLDQGFATMTLPQRDRGLLASFVALYSDPWCVLPEWASSLPVELKKIACQDWGPYEIIDDTLTQLGVNRDEWEPYILRTLLALSGWAGMACQMESHCPWTARPAPHGTLVEYLAVRLVLDRLAAKYVARKHLEAIRIGRSSLEQLREILSKQLEMSNDTSFRDAFLVYQVARELVWSPSFVQQLSGNDWHTLESELRAFDSLSRRRMLHASYERRYRQQALNAILSHHRSGVAQKTSWQSARSSTIPCYQVITCIDDREESLRRHLEEIEPGCETFGVAGFFAVAMYYRGAAEAHYRPQCPVNVTPSHYVREEPMFSAMEDDERRSKRRKRVGQISHWVHVGSRTLVGGVITGVLGSLATFPLVARIMAPRVTSRLRQHFGGIVRPPATELHLERESAQPGPDFESLGYSLSEMARIVVRMLQDIGLTSGFSPIVLILGHGSSSLNNPHESAYNCGACCGGRGGPNARAFAWMANHPKVRHLVDELGIAIPESVHFIGGYHNTCNDRIDYFDLDQVPSVHRKLFRGMENDFLEARRRNAKERCRRFESAPLTLSPEEALQHVEERAEDLSQARPEYNHATNAMCIVGQRSWSRGLFLDRRSFLVSYDPAIDDEKGTIVERILQAVIPVCGGISLEYFFSTVDTEVYGCGSKLPHNITSLAGVMTGAASDLRPGLSAQMVEIHEPLRLLFIVQSTPDVLNRVIEANQAIRLLVGNEWVQLALFDPKSGTMLLYRKGDFEPFELSADAIPSVSDSIRWCGGLRGHLGFASIVPEGV